MSFSEYKCIQRGSDFFSRPARLLATVMLLPLIDGLFPALVVSGSIDTLLGAIQIGLLVFGGSATAIVILSEFTGNPVTNLRAVLIVSGVLIVGSMIEAAFAPTITSFLNIPLFERFAGGVLLAIAVKTASPSIGKYIPRPGIIIGVGLLASFDPSSMSIVIVDINMELVFNAFIAAFTGSLFAICLVLGRVRFCKYFDIERFRFGSAIALSLVALSLYNLVPLNTSLHALILTVVLSFQPERLENKPSKTVSEKNID